MRLEPCNLAECGSEPPSPPPAPPLREPFVRLWSNASQWPEGELPEPDQDVEVPQQWNLLLDVAPEPMGILTIRGRLSFVEQG